MLGASHGDPTHAPRIPRHACLPQRNRKVGVSNPSKPPRPHRTSLSPSRLLCKTRQALGTAFRAPTWTPETPGVYRRCIGGVSEMYRRCIGPTRCQHRVNAGPSPYLPASIAPLTRSHHAASRHPPRFPAASSIQGSKFRVRGSRFRPRSPPSSILPPPSSPPRHSPPSPIHSFTNSPTH